VSNGHDFIDTALNLEAKTIVCDVYPENLEKVTYVKVADTNEALAFMAANYYANPSENLN
jgi:UDP-N-acetylmuramoyl-L-alanyl-D-glutamate--2,6-diaminopimelate ligase